MTTVDENGNVLNQRRLAVARELGIPYAQVADEQYNLYKRAQYINAYSMGPQSFASAFGGRLRQQALDELLKKRGGK